MIWKGYPKSGYPKLIINHPFDVRRFHMFHEKNTNFKNLRRVKLLNLFRYPQMISMCQNVLNQKNFSDV